MKDKERFNRYIQSTPELRLLCGVRSSFVLKQDWLMAVELFDEKVPGNSKPVSSCHDIVERKTKFVNFMTTFITETLTPEEVQYIKDLDEHFINDKWFQIKTKQLIDKLISEGYKERMKEAIQII